MVVHFEPHVTRDLPAVGMVHFSWFTLYPMLALIHKHRSIHVHVLL
jgi:hypothetical protein